MRQETLYVSDLDGTLLNSRDEISPHSLRIINGLIEKGMKFTYATARSLASASKVTRGLSLHIPVIIYNGAFIREADTEKTLYSVRFSEEEQKYIENFLEGAGLFRITLQQELYRPEYWMEIMPAKASKAEAIRELKKLWRCERIVSFGDSMNDIPMFSVSDEAYAVENAVEELKKHALGTIPSNDDDGVAEFLQKRFFTSD